MSQAPQTGIKASNYLLAARKFTGTVASLNNLWSESLKNIQAEGDLSEYGKSGQTVRVLSSRKEALQV